MRSLCPFTKSTCDEEACALWLKELVRCSIKEIAMRMVQSSDLVRELERLKVDIEADERAVSQSSLCSSFCFQAGGSLL